jgi:ribosome biogenesis GTPase A
MAKTRRKITESLNMVDAVVEIVDARIPVSSRNPELAGIIVKKPLLVLLNKCDVADPTATSKWVKWFEAQGIKALAVDCRSGKGVDMVVPTIKELLKKKSNRIYLREWLEKHFGLWLPVYLMLVNRLSLTVWPRATVLRLKTDPVLQGVTSGFRLIRG